MAAHHRGEGRAVTNVELLVRFAEAEVMQRLSPGTSAKHSAKLLGLARDVELTPLLDLSTDDIRAWMAARSPRWSAGTVSDYRASLHRFYSWALHEGLIDRDPVAPLVRLRLPIEVGDYPALARDYRISMERRGLKATTILIRTRVMRRLADHIAPRSLLDVSAGDIDHYLDANRTSPKSRYTQISNLHNFYRWALKQGLVEKDPTLDVERPHRFHGVPQPISHEDLARALDGAPPRLRAMLALAAFEGLRCQEIAGLHREDILDHLDPPVLIVGDGKGSKQRILPLHPEVWQAIRDIGCRAPGRCSPSGGIGRPTAATSRRPATPTCMPAAATAPCTPFGTGSGRPFTRPPATFGWCMRCSATAARRPPRSTPRSRPGRPPTRYGLSPCERRG
jgi:site-specific recombinase XerD